MSFDFKPTVPLEEAGAEAYMLDYANQRREWLAERGGFDAVEDEEGVVQLVEREKATRQRKVTVLEPKVRIGDDELGISARRVYRAAISLGLETHCWLIVSEFDPVLYVHDGEDHSAGEVRYPGFIARRYVVEARLPDQMFGFQAHYQGEGREGSTGSFEWARIRDPYGIEVENYFDYTKDKVIADTYGWTEERRIQEGMAANRRLNDGSTRTEVIQHHKTAGEFTTWLDDYLRVKGLKVLTPQRKPKQTAEERESALISGGEWNG